MKALGHSTAPGLVGIAGALAFVCALLAESPYGHADDVRDANAGIVVGFEAASDVSARAGGKPLVLAPFVMWHNKRWSAQLAMVSSPAESFRSQGICTLGPCDDHDAGMAARGERALWQRRTHHMWASLYGGVGVAWRRFDGHAVALELSGALRLRGAWWHAEAGVWLRGGLLEHAEGNRSRWGVPLAACLGRRVGPCVRTGVSAPFAAVGDNVEVPVAIGAHGEAGRFAATIFVAMPRAFGPQQFLQTRYVLAALAWRR